MTRGAGREGKRRLLWGSDGGLGGGGEKFGSGRRSESAGSFCSPPLWRPLTHFHKTPGCLAVSSFPLWLGCLDFENQKEVKWKGSRNSKHCSFLHITACDVLLRPWRRPKPLAGFPLFCFLRQIVGRPGTRAATRRGARCSEP